MKTFTLSSKLYASRWKFIKDVSHISIKKNSLKDMVYVGKCLLSMRKNKKKYFLEKKLHEEDKLNSHLNILNI